MTWDPSFIARSPMLGPLREPAARLCGCRDWPSRETLQALVSERAVHTANGDALRLVAPQPGTLSYEARVSLAGELQVRERNWHDLFNVLAWAAYPRTKAAINAAHDREEKREAPGAGCKRRSGARDALTLFDENGAVVLSCEPTLRADLRAFRWKRLFVERRDETRAALRFYVVGHALFEKALQPYLGLSAHALVFDVESRDIARPSTEQLEIVDALAAAAIGTLTATRTLAPLPLLGVPGWWADNERPDFYDDERYFRPGRTARAERVSRPPSRTSRAPERS